MSSAGATDAVAVLRAALAAAGLEVDEPSPGRFVVTLPGERKLRTTCALVVGAHSLSVNAFVARRPDEGHEALYRWMLERNVRLYGVAFALDRLGDVYLVGRLPLASVTPAEVDRLLGSVLAAADESFDTILRMGFATAIRAEWDWRTSRGEPTTNLEQFRHVVERREDRGTG